MGYNAQDVDPILQIEVDIAKAEKDLKELKAKMQNLELEIHVLQMNLTTLKNIEEKK